MPAGGLRVHLADLAEVRAVAARAAAVLTESDRASVLRYAGARRVLAEASRMLARAALAAEPDRAAAAAIEADEWGRPWLVGSSLCFNVSHDGALLAVAVAGRPCGIDVEDAAEDDLREVAARFCAPDELGGRARPLWVAKESAAKAMGRGLRAGLATIRFTGDPATGWSAVTWKGCPTELWTRTADLGARHIGLTAQAGPQPSVHVRTWRPRSRHGRWWFAPAHAAATTRAVAARLSADGRG